MSRWRAFVYLPGRHSVVGERWAFQRGEPAGAKDGQSIMITVARNARRERGWRSALPGARALLKHYPPWQRWGRPPEGRALLGSLRRLKPVNLDFGFGRGQPIHGYYIEKVLARHADDGQGRVLEKADDSYSQKFVGGRDSVSDVLHLGNGKPSGMRFLYTVHAACQRATSVGTWVNFSRRRARRAAP